MAPTNGTYTIGEFSRLCGLSPRTVDFYTRRGLLHPDQPGRGHGYRRYGQEDRRRVALIRKLQARKFSLREIRRILEDHVDERVSAVEEAMARLDQDLDRMHELLQVKPAAPMDSPAVRAMATEVLRKAAALCSLLVTLL